MVTSRDREITQALLSPARGVEATEFAEHDRTMGFLVAFYDEFFSDYGNRPIPAGKLNKKIPGRFVRDKLDVGAEPKNRNLSDQEVVGSRFQAMGWIEVLPHPEYKVRLTDDGRARAEEIIASLEANKE